VAQLTEIGVVCAVRRQYVAATMIMVIIIHRHGGSFFYKRIDRQQVKKYLAFDETQRLVTQFCERLPSRQPTRPYTLRYLYKDLKQKHLIFTLYLYFLHGAESFRN